MRNRFGHLVVTCILSGAMIGCGAAPPAISRGGTTGGIEVYAVPAANPRLDGTLYLHSGGSSATTDQLLGQGIDAMSVPAVAPGGAAAASIQWYSSSTSTTMLSRPGESSFGLTAANTAAGDSTVPLTSLEAGGIRYVQADSSVIAVRAGKIVATYPLPVLKPDDSAGKLPPYYKGVYSGAAAGTVSALVPASSGDILAFTFTGRAAAVTDLITNRTTPLAGYSRLGAAARTETGDIAVVAWKAQEESAHIKLITLDGTDFTVASVLDTGLAATNHLRDVVLPGLGHDAVVAIAHGDETTGVDLKVWTVDGQTLTAEPALPNNIGLTIAPADATSIYVYGGPARNTVGQLDLSSGTFGRDVPALRTPVGSYIVGIVQ
jgi:hypothetical protein